jgi:ATP-binding cassette subfamily B protein
MSSIVVFGMASAALHTINPILIKNIINGLSSNLNSDYIRRNVLLILGVGSGIYITNMIAQRNRAYMNMRLEWEFRKKVFDHIIRLDRNFYHKHTTGDLVTRLVDDISNKISWFSCSGVFRFVQSMFTIIAVISTMLYFNPVLTFWVLLPVPLILTFSIKTGKVLSGRYTALQESITALYDFLETCFTGIRLIKANAKENSQEVFFSDKTSAQKKAEISTARLSLVFSFFFHYAGFFSVVLLYIVGGRMVMDGRSSLGELIAFQFYSGMIVHPLMDISNFFISGNRAGVSIRRIDELLNMSSGIRRAGPGRRLESVRELEFSKTTLKNPKGDGFLLKDISFTAKRGERFAIVGKIGCGKSTLLALTLRLNEHDGGEIRLNGHDIRTLDLARLRERLGYTSQEASIFTGTVLENIVMDRPGITQDMIDKALEIAQLKREMHKFPKGLNTSVGTRGFSISGGQKQRLAVARAVLTSPDILLLDDATSAMDAQTEDDFWKAFRKELPDTICLAVTHRAHTIETSDQILTLSEGRIAERGTHAELMSLNGLYKQIYERTKLQEELGQKADSKD